MLGTIVKTQDQGCSFTTHRNSSSVIKRPAAVEQLRVLGQAAVEQRGSAAHAAEQEDRRVDRVLRILGRHAEPLAQDLVFSGSDFSTWGHPQGLVNVQPDGIEVKRFGKSFNAVANADEMPTWNPGDEFEAARLKALEEASD